MIRKDPYRTYLFHVEVFGIIAGGFSEVSGLSVNTEVKSFREGGVNDFEYVIPVSTKYSNITLKRGLTDVDLLWRWYERVINGRVNRISGSIILRGHDGLPDQRWHFKRAFPIKWEGPSLNASSSNVIATEMIELAHEGLFKI